MLEFRAASEAAGRSQPYRAAVSSCVCSTRGRRRPS